jgi:hypothetical protein
LLLLEVWDDFSGGDELVGTARLEVSSLKRTAWAEFEERQVQYIIHYAPYTILI